MGVMKLLTHRFMMNCHLKPIRVLVLTCWISVSWALDDAQTELDSTLELLSLNFEELTELDVSSLARQRQIVKNSPNAAFVITAEDIRRSGATNIPDVLRMVPGMNVARLNSWGYAVSARGFNDFHANKLQVMIDGRSIYDPMTSGVYWDQHNIAIQDIERIEVMKGPSGTLWGANSVNGVINIITRSAKDTLGGLIVAGGGSEERGLGTLRYGQKLSDSTFMRGTLNALIRDENVDKLGINATGDDGDTQTANFRLDSQLSTNDHVMAQANVVRYRPHFSFMGKALISPPDPIGFDVDYFGADGVNASLQGQWRHQNNSGDEFNLNLTYLQTNWKLNLYEIERWQTILDFQHTLPVISRHHLIWGLSSQIIDDQFTNSRTLSYQPAELTQHNVGIFLQDRIDITDELQLTLGNRVEHFTYTGWETEPNARLIWTPHKNHRLWAAISRAVVLPSRGQHDIHLYTPLPGGRVFAEATGNPKMLTENLLAYELGWRWQLAYNLDIDTALFYNIYDRMQGTQFTGPPYIDPSLSLQTLILPSTVGNYRQVDSYGLELSANYRVNHEWRLQASYTANQFRVDYDASHARWLRDPLVEPHANPQQSVSFRSLYDLTDDIELDGWIRYVDELLIQKTRIPSYVALDLRLGWHPHKNLEISLVGQNLLDNQHPEFQDLLFVPVASQIQRGYLATLNWRF